MRRNAARITLCLGLTLSSMVLLLFIASLFWGIQLRFSRWHSAGVAAGAVIVHWPLPGPLPTPGLDAPAGVSINRNPITLFWRMGTNTGGGMRGIWFPLPLLFAVFAFPTGLMWWRWRKHRRAAGRCRRCRYDVRGLPTGRCPECGAEYPVDLTPARD